LFNVPLGKAVDIKVAQRMEENYEEPEKKVQAFNGTGNRLGAVVPPSAQADPHRMPGSFPTSSAVAAPVIKIDVDPSKPTTSIQIRLADGTKYISLT
jgi:UBX domain-containing protein 1